MRDDNSEWLQIQQEQQLFKRNKMETKTKFEQLSALNVAEHIEKKGKFSYLSWPWAVDQLRRADPKATWEVRRFDDKPFMATECGYFVEVAVSVDGITLSQIHPVLDSSNRPIAMPNAFQINTSIQRCLVKAIALHGLGLYIFAGEDLPESEEGKPAVTSPQRKSVDPSTGEITKKEKPVSDELATEGEKNFIRNKLKASNYDLENALNSCGMTDFDALTKDGFIAMKDWIKANA